MRVETHQSPPPTLRALSPLKGEGRFHFVRIVFAALFFLFFLISFQSVAKVPQKTVTLAIELQHELDQALLTLDPVKAGSLALRLYRVTGDKRYHEFLRPYLDQLKTDFRRHADHLQVKGYPEMVARELLANKKPATTEGVKRLKLRSGFLSKRLVSVFDRRLLFLAAQIRSLGGHKHADVRNSYRRVIRYLRHSSLKQYVLDRETLLVNATRATNVVFYMKSAGVLDIREEYTALFKDVFLTKPNSELMPFDFFNKIYGMTHFIIGDSGFYQRHINPEKYAWIFDELDSSSELVLKKLSPDAVAELAVCFKLAGLSDHPLVLRVQADLRQKIKASRSGYYLERPGMDFRLAKHRHIVSWLAFADMTKLHRGPILVH